MWNRETYPANPQFQFTWQLASGLYYYFNYTFWPPHILYCSLGYTKLANNIHSYSIAHVRTNVGRWKKLTLNKKPSCSEVVKYRSAGSRKQLTSAGVSLPIAFTTGEFNVDKKLILTLPIHRLIMLHRPSRISSLAALRKSAEQSQWESWVNYLNNSRLDAVLHDKLNCLDRPTLPKAMNPVHSLCKQS